MLANLRLLHLEAKLLLGPLCCANILALLQETLPKVGQAHEFSVQIERVLGAMGPQSTAKGPNATNTIWGAKFG